MLILLYETNLPVTGMLLLLGLESSNWPW